MQLLHIKCSANGVGTMKLHDEDSIESLVTKYVNMLMHADNRDEAFNCREDAEKAV